VATDPEAQRSAVTVVRKRPADPEGRLVHYRRDVIDELVEQMINERFEELAQKPDAKFLGAGAYDDSLSPEVDAFNLSASVVDGGIEPGLTAVATEAERLRQHGFGAPELDRAKKWMLASYERAYAERDKTESVSFANEYVRHFLNDEPSPGIEYEVEFVRDLLPGIRIEETHDAIRRLLGDGSRVVLAVSPQKADLRIPTNDQLLAALAAGQQAQVTAWSESETRSPKSVSPS
jgi:zinc protease